MQMLFDDKLRELIHDRDYIAQLLENKEQEIDIIKKEEEERFEKLSKDH